jgi:hypothetical protein
MKRREFITLLAVGSCLAHCFARAADERTVRWWGYSHDIQTGYLIEARAAAGASQGVNGRGRQMARTTYVLAVAVGLLAAVISSNINGAFAIDDWWCSRPPAPGEHWYYRSEPANNRKCWHIGESGTKPLQEAPVTRTSSPAALLAEHAPSTRSEQPDEQRGLLTNQAESPFEE